MNNSPSQNVSLRNLPNSLKKSAITADDADYDTARTVYYSGIDRRPAAIVRPADAGDVARAVVWARETGLELAVRSGGHSVAGHGVSDGGLVIDLANMQRLDINTEERTAWAETGLTTGAYTAAAGTHGLATGFGDTGSVGIGGLTLGGGVGFLHRKYGLTIDSLLAAEVVTADGRLLRTDAETHPDLFWALRGGGGNFGVATRFLFRLHEADEVVGGMMVLPATPEVIATCVSEAIEAPDELSGMFNVMVAPPMPFLPAEVHGRPIVMAFLVYAGPADAGERALAPFRSPAPPIVDQIQPMRYPELYEGPEPPRPPAVTTHPLFLDALDRTTAETVLDHLQASTAMMKMTQFRVLGGAVARVPSEATAFAHRRRRVLAVVGAAYEDPEQAAEHEAWAADLASALHQGASGAYVGFLGNDGESGVRAAYPSPTWERLRDVKARYDPTNLFRLNQNIPPAD